MPGGQARSVWSESLTAAGKLRRSADFQRCYRSGHRAHGSFVVLYTLPNESGAPRLGITASRKVGGSVTRQKVKRRIREVYRRWGSRPELPALDFLFHVKPSAGKAEFTDLKRELERLLEARVRQAGNLRPNSAG